MTASTTKKIESGFTDGGNPFSQRIINGNQVLIQRNRCGVWHGYFNQTWKQAFTCKKQANEWLENFPLADAE